MQELLETLRLAESQAGRAGLLQEQREIRRVAAKVAREILKGKLSPNQS